MNKASQDLVSGAFAAFYSSWVPAPMGRMAEREFGYIPFGGAMIRHLSFASQSALAAFIRKTSPQSAYVSSVYYRSPTAPMEDKGWLGADLIFDIDADHVPSDCRKRHDKTICKKCYSVIEPPKRKCAACGSAETQEIRWFCRECLDAAKEHTKRVVGSLVNDFGVKRDALTIYFSGNRGYHIYVSDDRFQKLGSVARGEISDYLLGKDVGLSPDGFRWASGGWYGRLRFTPLIQQKTGTVKPSKETIAERNMEVDSSVTNDIHRIFRMPGTLHGSSGLLKMLVKDIDAFDPLNDSVVIGDALVPVEVGYSPEFEFKGVKYGSYSAATTLLPLHAAVYLILKGLAEVVEKP